MKFERIPFEVVDKNWDKVSNTLHVSIPDYLRGRFLLIDNMKRYFYSGQLVAWFLTDRESIKHIIVTSILIDQICELKNICVYAAMSFGHVLSPDDEMLIYNELMKYGREMQIPANLLVIYTSLNLSNRLEKFGAKKQEVHYIPIINGVENADS